MHVLRWLWLHRTLQSRKCPPMIVLSVSPAQMDGGNAPTSDVFPALAFVTFAKTVALVSGQQIVCVPLGGPVRLATSSTALNLAKMAGPALAPILAHAHLAGLDLPAAHSSALSPVIMGELVLDLTPAHAPLGGVELRVALIRWGRRRKDFSVFSRKEMEKKKKKKKKRTLFVFEIQIIFLGWERREWRKEEEKKVERAMLIVLGNGMARVAHKGGGPAATRHASHHNGAIGSEWANALDCLSHACSGKGDSVHHHGGAVSNLDGGHTGGKREVSECGPGTIIREWA